ncbi:hypothetical protein [Ornithinimicrobium flavum]|uniref:hypothetical protein n=1 Tax=Ornithinimicrobium flavum TaxID=1288636 RepID=UPI00106F6530|nr:hypothetical protein [Ornithinimicrobium flavum]
MRGAPPRAGDSSGLDHTRSRRKVSKGADQWVHNPSSSVLFITAGDMSGHYVIRDVTGHGVPGLVQAADVPEDYDSYPVVLQWERGLKTGHETETCLVVSRFAPMDFTVIGPVTLTSFSG